MICLKICYYIDFLWAFLSSRKYCLHIIRSAYDKKSTQLFSCTVYYNAYCSAHLVLCAAANDCDDGDDYDCENSVIELNAGCAQRVFNNSADIACVCNSTYCDTFPSLGQLHDKQSAVYISSKSGKRFEKSVLEFSNQTG